MKLRRSVPVAKRLHGHQVKRNALIYVSWRARRPRHRLRQTKTCDLWLERQQCRSHDPESAHGYCPRSHQSHRQAALLFGVQSRKLGCLLRFQTKPSPNILIAFRGRCSRPVKAFSSSLATDPAGMVQMKRMPELTRLPMATHSQAPSPFFELTAVAYSNSRYGPTAHSNNGPRHHAHLCGCV